MEEAELLIQELRIDNESLLTNSYNPLKQFLINKRSNSSFRNTFHRVEKVMESIIDISYKGFSDSVLSYMEVYNNNTRIRELLRDLKMKIEYIKNIKFNINSIKEIFRETEYMRIKNEKVNDLNLLWKYNSEYMGLNEAHIEEYNSDIWDTTDYHQDIKKRPTKLSNIIKKLSLLNKMKTHIKDKKLYLIEGIEIMRNDILNEMNKSFTEVYEKLMEYILEGNLENKCLLVIVKNMQREKEFEEFVNRNLKKYINKLKMSKWREMENLELFDEGKIQEKADGFLETISDLSLVSIYNHNSEFVNEYLKINLIKLANQNTEEDKKNDDLKLLLIFEDDKFKKIDYYTNTLCLYKLIDKYDISISILYDKLKSSKIEVSFYLLNTVYLLNKKYKDKLLDKLIVEYYTELKDKVCKEVLYYLDLYIREGNYENEYYIYKMVNILNKNKELLEFRINQENEGPSEVVINMIERINKYLKAKNISDEKLKDKLRLIDEIFGEISGNYFIVF